MELVQVLRIITGCDSSGIRMRRDWGSGFAPLSRIRERMLGSLIRARSGRVPVGCYSSRGRFLAATVFEAFAWGLVADFFVLHRWSRLGIDSGNNRFEREELG